MATSSSCACEDLDGVVKEVFYLYVERYVGKELPVAQKSEAKCSVVRKLFKECFDSKVAITVESTILSKHYDKKSVLMSSGPRFFHHSHEIKKLSLHAFINKVLPDLAKAIAADKKKTKDISSTDPAGELYRLKKKIADKYYECTPSEKKTKNMEVVERLTDVKRYTGSHMLRFDETGKGNRMDGRMEVTEDYGYVVGYKGAGAYDQTH